MVSHIPKTIAVVVADACSVMRTGLVQTIEAEPQMRVVARAAHHHELIHTLCAIGADVLVVDPVGFGGAPFTLMREIMQAYPRLGVVVFSAIADFVPELLATGVHAYVAQKETDNQLHLAIRAAKARQRFLSPLIQAYVDCWALPTVKGRLWPRELCCLMYMAQGLDNRTICLCMNVELRTVENYVSKIRAKTGCDSRMQMIAWYQTVYGDANTTTFNPRLIHSKNI